MARKKTADYYRITLDFCLRLNSTASGNHKRILAARALAEEALDTPGDKPLDCEIKLSLFLQSDPDYANGSLRGTSWSKVRATRATRWLKVWRDLKEALASLPATSVLPQVNVEPPDGANILPGMPAKMIKDPALRKQYEDDIKKNDEVNRLFRLKEDTLQLARLFETPAKHYIIDIYSKPPYNTDELDQLLAGSVLDAATRTAILDEVKRRVAARPDPALAPPQPAPAPVPSPAPSRAPSDWRTDPRLQVPVTLNLREPKVDQVLRELQTATRVDLTRGDDIQNSASAYGSLVTSGVPAWNVMENLANAKRVEGTWVAAGGGYRLVSNGTPPQLSNSAGGQKSDRPQPTPRDNATRYALIAGSGLILILAGAVLWRFRRRRTSTPEVRPQEGGGPAPN